MIGSARTLMTDFGRMTRGGCTHGGIGALPTIIWGRCRFRADGDRHSDLKAAAVPI